MLGDFKAKGVNIVGVSNDPVAANDKFACEYGFSYPLICDESLTVSVAYGAAADTQASASKRIAVLVGKEGAGFVVKDVWMKVDARAFPKELLANLPAKIPSFIESDCTTKVEYEAKYGIKK